MLATRRACGGTATTAQHHTPPLSGQRAPLAAQHRQRHSCMRVDSRQRQQQWTQPQQEQHTSGALRARVMVRAADPGNGSGSSSSGGSGSSSSSITDSEPAFLLKLAGFSFLGAH